MIRNLLATTAIATLVATGAFAQTAPATTETAPAADQAAPVVKSDGNLASHIIGENVYNGTAENAENIGDVSDIVIAADGKVESVIVGVGGFLGIGEKNVAVNYADVDWAEKDGDRWLVVGMTKEQLEAQPAFDRTPYDPAPAPVAAAPAATTTEQTAMAPATTADPAAPATAPADTTAAAPATATDPAASTTAQNAAPTDAAAPAATDTTQTAAIDKSTLTEMPATDIRAEEMVGTTVYGTDDSNLGEIGDVILTSDGKVDAYIVDVGGFLGVGEKEVAVGTDNLSFMTDKDGNKYLYTNFTKEQLDAAPAYDKTSWAEKRDDQRMIMTQ